ncbi:hypothetical protein LTR67_008925 [Exophiala xenobiotica]
MNVSRIANEKFNNSTGNGCNCVEFVNGTLTINGSAVTDGHTTVEVYDIGISEYYAVYTMNYCEGNYLPHYYDKGAKAVLTSCKTPSVSRRFDMVSIIEDALDNVGASLNQSLSLDDLDWPDGITNAFDYVASASTAMVAFFFIALVFLLLATLTGTIALFRPSKDITVILLMTSVIAFMTLAICAGLSTAVITTVVNGINSNGDDIGVSAKQGDTFMALMWSAVALLFVSSLTTTAQLCTGGGGGGGREIGRQRRRREHDGYGYHMPMSMGYGGHHMPHHMSHDPMSSRSMSHHMSHPYHHHSSHYDPWDSYGSRRSLVPPHMDDLYGEDDFR